MSTGRSDGSKPRAGSEGDDERSERKVIRSTSKRGRGKSRVVPSWHQPYRRLVEERDAREAILKQDAGEDNGPMGRSTLSQPFGKVSAGYRRKAARRDSQRWRQ